LYAIACHKSFVFNVKHAFSGGYEEWFEVPAPTRNYHEMAVSSDTSNGFSTTTGEARPGSLGIDIRLWVRRSRKSPSITLPLGLYARARRTFWTEFLISATLGRRMIRYDDFRLG
jgi:hypothetical protein